VQLVKDAPNLRLMEDVVDKFTRKLSSGGIGLFYYAGHGVAVNGENYLIPVKADLKFQEDAKYESLPVEYVLSALESSKSNMNIIILDACRNNPLPMKSRSLVKGLAEIRQKMKETIIMFATAPGDTAEDGSGQHGAYTQHLMDVIKKPGLTIEQMAKEVRKKVIETTDNYQVPWENNSLVNDFCFVSCPGAPVAPSTVSPPMAPKPDNPVANWSKPVAVEAKRETVVSPPRLEPPPSRKETPQVTTPAAAQPPTKPVMSTPTAVPPTSSSASSPPVPAPTTLQSPAKCVLEPWRCR
jgi:hypothetical protein